MTPAQRERLRVALERETGVGWIYSVGWADYLDSTTGEWTIHRERRHGLVVRVSLLRSGDTRQIDIAHATGRGWPERLAAEVGRVIRESNNSPARVGEE